MKVKTIGEYAQLLMPTVSDLRFIDCDNEAENRKKS